MLVTQNGTAVTTRSVIGIGASAGGIEALVSLLRRVPADVPAALLIVLHMSPSSPGALTRILGRVTRLPVSDAEEGALLQAGRVYVAPPDHHMLVGQEKVHLSQGLRENGHRPAVNPLFRSMALAFGPRSVGVVLSGNLDDGAAGLLAVHRSGGITVVQSPEDAMYSGMPTAAVNCVPVDHVVPVEQIGPLLDRLARETGPDEALVERRDGAATFSCPDCGGALYPRKVQEAMWVALRALEERATLRRRMAERARSSRLPLAARGYEGTAEEDDQRARMLRSVLKYGG